MTELALANQIKAWQSGIAAERVFWDHWFATKGDRWPADFSGRLQSEREIEAWILGPSPSPGMKILDVGAGPMTILGPYFQGKRLDITACDPLAHIYTELADKYNVLPPVPTELAFAEDLSSFYPTNSFDLVHCRNALDHSFDPVRGITEMLNVTKVGGRVLLRHFLNEAEHENYEGFHQWNFAVSNGDFIVWNREQRVNATKHFADAAAVEAELSGREVIVTLKKAQTAEHEDDPKRRIRDLLRSLVSAAEIRS